MTTCRVLVCAWLPEGVLEAWRAATPWCDFVRADSPQEQADFLPTADAAYGLPPVGAIPHAPRLKWVQLISAGVPADLLPVASAAGVRVTNLAGLYGSTIAEHAFGLMTMLARRFHTAHRNQMNRTWDRSIGRPDADLRGRTLGILGLGDIGRSVARLGRAYGMRVVGTRRRADMHTPEADEVYPPERLHDMLAVTDCLVVAAPLVPSTDRVLDAAAFAALKPGAMYVNVSRGGVTDEAALVSALRSGRVSAAGADVFAVEPLPADSPLWTMDNVVVIPHVAGEVVNQSSRPAERFARNLEAFKDGGRLEGEVDLAEGY